MCSADPRKPERGRENGTQAVFRSAAGIFVCYDGRMIAYMVKRDATMCSAMLSTAWWQEPERSRDHCVIVRGSVEQSGERRQA